MFVFKAHPTCIIQANFIFINDEGDVRVASPTKFGDYYFINFENKNKDEF